MKEKESKDSTKNETASNETASDKSVQVVTVEKPAVMNSLETAFNYMPKPNENAKNRIQL